MTTKTPAAPGTTNPDAMSHELRKALFIRLDHLVDAMNELVGHANSHRATEPVPPKVRGLCTEFAIHATGIASMISEWAIEPESEDRDIEQTHGALTALAMAMTHAAGAPDHAPLTWQDATFAASRLLPEIFDAVGDSFTGPVTEAA